MNELSLLEKLLDVCGRLLGPEGCPWDREQTLMSSRKYVLEEICELIEAIDLGDNHHIQEELGDLFYNAIFLSRLAEKEGRASLSGAVKEITEKLIRRHPHVFGGIKEATTEEIVHNWEKIKKEEKGKSHRSSVLDGIPKSLPALSRASKIINRMKRQRYPGLEIKGPLPDFSSEDALGEYLWQIVQKAQDLGLDPEHSLRSALAKEERIFRDFEGSKEG
jgi:tetrapyrrole methylase family protein/MazG family protein